MTSRLQDALAPVAESFRIHSGHAFSLLGQRWESPPTQTQDDTSSLSQPASAQLADVLYRVLHCGQPLHTSYDPAAQFRPYGRDFLAQLSNANCGTGPWHDNWMLLRIDDEGRRVVEQDGLRLWVDETDFDALATPANTRTTARVRFPKEYRALYPGHYVVLGDCDSGVTQDPLRVYWNIKADAAVTFIAHVTDQFNRAQVGFKLKVLSDPAAYTRTDAGIMYIGRSDLAPGMELVWAVHEQVRYGLNPNTSVYTREIAPGLAIAEDPGDAQSFGQQRSELLARALCARYGATNLAAAVLDEVSQAGYDPEHFYLNPGSSNTYDALTRDGNGKR